MATKRNKFDVDEELEEKFDLKQFKRVSKYIIPYKGKIALILLIIFIANMSGIIGPYLLKIAIDESIPNKDTNQLYILSAVFTGFLVISAICGKLRIKYITKLGQDVLEDMRLDIFSHLQKLPFTYYDSRPHGKILIRVVNYINNLSDLLSNGLINLISDIINVFATLVFMFIIDARLTLYSLVLMPVLFIIIMFIKNAQRKAYQKLSNKQSNMNAYIHESIEGIRITQSFAREEENFNIFDDVNNEYRNSWMKAVKIQFLLWPTVIMISVLSTSIIYLVGIKLSDFTISTGVLIAFIGYTNNFWNPIINIGNFYNSLITATAYLERIFETLDVKPDVVDIKGAKDIPQVKGNIEFKYVTFGYDESKLILKDINFKVEKGESIALVGPTGAGKTTIINLLSRFYNINSGEILVDGHDISKVTLNSLRKQMGVMLQDTFIFSGTIMDNIRYGKLDATDEEVIEASKAVKAHDFIETFKEGYNTEVNERGNKLSAGQRQLIAFARTLLSDPKILILDEATSSIDTKTEIDLQIGLDRLLKDRTSFIIAHRLSTIKNATRIFYIDKQKVQEAGNHDELMELKGNYYRLYNAQFNVLKAI